MFFIFRSINVNVTFEGPTHSLTENGTETPSHFSKIRSIKSLEIILSKLVCSQSLFDNIDNRSATWHLIADLPAAHAFEHSPRAHHILSL